MPFVLEACRRGDHIEATFITAPPLAAFLERELADLEPPPNVRVVRAHKEPPRPRERYRR